MAGFGDDGIAEAIEQNGQGMMILGGSFFDSIRIGATREGDEK